MALTQFGTNDPETQNLWSNKTYYEALKNTIGKTLMGDMQDAVIGLHDDLTDKAGDMVKYDILMEPTGNGVEGDNRLKDNEEAMVYHQDYVKIDLKRNAHKFTGMTQQRTVHNLRKDAQKNMSKWLAAWLDYTIMHQLGADTALSFANTPVAVDTSHYVVCGDVAHGTVLATQEASLSDNDEIDLLDLDYAKERAQVATPQCEPAMYDGQECHVAILHPYQMTDIRVSTSAATVKWHEIQQYANQRGLKNPIFTKANGVYNGIILLESTRIYTPRSNVYRALFLGKQAGVYALGNPYNLVAKKGGNGAESYMTWYEDIDDYGNETGVGIGMCVGIKACVFNSTRLGGMVVTSYAAAKG